MSSRYAKIKQYIRKVLQEPKDGMFKSKNGNVLVWTYHSKGLGLVRVTVGYNGTLTKAWLRPDFTELPAEFDRLRDIPQGTMCRQVAKALRGTTGRVRYGSRELHVGSTGRVMLTHDTVSIFTGRLAVKPNALAHWLLYGVLAF